MGLLFAAPFLRADSIHQEAKRHMWLQKDMKPQALGYTFSSGVNVDIL